MRIWRDNDGIDVIVAHDCREINFLICKLTVKVPHPTVGVTVTGGRDVIFPVGDWQAKCGTGLT